jgi:uncharacterized membrane protein
MKFARKEGNKGIIISGIIGILISLIFCILLLIPIPMFNCSLGKESYICLVVWICLGIVFYVSSRR